MHRKNPFFHLGFTLFLTVCGILLFYDTLSGGRELLSIWRQFLGAVRPILYGAFLAYLLAPAVNFFERELLSHLAGKNRRPSAVRAGSILLIWLIIGVGLYLLCSVLLPELYSSVVLLVSNAESYYNTIVGWVEGLLETNPAFEQWASAQMNDVYESFMSWLKYDALPQMQTVMTMAAGSVMTLVGFVMDVLVGIIVSVYLLSTKEGCAALGRKIVYSAVPREKVRWVLRGVHKADGIFSGFVRGKLLDSLIIGVLCFIGCSFLKFPYTPLISVFIGVTNVIPFFGPFLGAIPSAFLILLVDPLKALYFLIFVLVLQQLDGNVIGPKILGDKTGLSSLWVMIAILVGGSFFGVAGMFFGVPVCACLYCFFNFLVDVRLRRRDLPVELEAYASDEPGEASGQKNKKM